MNMKVKVVKVKENGEESKKITEIAWNSYNFNEFIEKLENAEVDSNKIEQIKRWCW